MSANIMVATRLREARSESGLNQKEASIALGIPLSTLARYEQAVTDVTGDALARMAKAYGVTADWILGLSEFRTNLQGRGRCEQCMPFLNAYVQMNEGSKGTLNEVVDAFVYRDCNINKNDVDQNGDGNNSVVVGDNTTVVNCSGDATLAIGREDK